MSKFKITNADSPIEKDLYQDIPIKDPDTGLDQVDSEGNILAKRYVTRSINKNGINNIKKALPQININKSEIARIDTYAKNQVAAINTSIRDIEENVLQNQKDLSDHDTRISTIQSKLNNIQGIDIDEVQADVDALKKSAYLVTGGVLNGDVSIQTPNTAVLTLTPKGSSSYASFSTTNSVLDCTTTWGKVFKASEEGKYFYGLADKAVADKKGQDVTSYIRSIIGANATLTITKGDNTSQSLSINNVLQATKAIQDKNGAQIDTTYFKAANGSFTGTEYNRSINKSYLRLSGGKTRNGGAVIHLHGYDHDNGEFALGATVKGDGSDYKYFRGTPTGSLTWDGKNIVRSINSINADAFGNVSLTQLVSGLITTTYIAGAKGKALVSSTAPAGSYVVFNRGASNNGIFCTSTFLTRYQLHYLSNATIKADTNNPDKTVTLLDESGNSSFPGIVSGTFSGNLSGTASHATSADSATNASHATSANSATTATTATKANALTGFNYNNKIGWGIQTGTPVMGMDDGAGGSLGFRKNCPSNGKVSMVIDGYIYQNEGQYQVIDTNTIGSQHVASADSAANANHATSANSAATATKASQNAAGHSLDDTIVKAISISGRTITVTKLDGKTYTLTTQDTNTTYSKVSQFQNDSGFITTNGRAYPRKVGGAAINFNWTGKSGQPTWLWGGENGTDMYVYNPSNFSVHYAASAGSAGSVAWTNVSGRPTNVSQFTNNSGYITDAHNFSKGVKVSGYTITVG